MKKRINKQENNEHDVINCPTCGEDNPDRSKYCMNCGSAIMIEQPVRRPSVPSRRPSSQYGQLYQPQSYYPRYQEPLSTWAYICACCVPLAGFAIWLSIKDNRPDDANTILVLAVLNLLLAFFTGVNS